MSSCQTGDRPVCRRGAEIALPGAMARLEKGATTMRTKTTIACALTAFVAVAGGTAEATGLIHTSQLAKGAVTFNRLAPKVQKMVLRKATNGVNGLNGAPGAQGAPGAPGATGAAGAPGATGAAGAPGATGAAGAPGAQGVQGDPGAAARLALTARRGPRARPARSGAAGATARRALMVRRVHRAIRATRVPTGLRALWVRRAIGRHGCRRATALWSTGRQGRHGCRRCSGRGWPAGLRTGADGTNGAAMVRQWRPRATRVPTNGTQWRHRAPMAPTARRGHGR